MIEVLKKRKLIVIVLLAYVYLLLFKNSLGLEALDSSKYYLIEMVQILPVIFMLTVAIDVLIPKEWIIKRMGKKSGLTGNVLALLLGSISAGPIYAAFPVTKMLLKKGASVGNAVIILSAWAVVKVPMLLNEAKFLGPDFMVIRWILTVILIFIMGWGMNKTSFEIPDSHDKKGLYIDDDYCINCGLCAKMAPEIFFEKQGKIHIKPAEEVRMYEQMILKTMEKCPVKAIQMGGQHDRKDL